MVGYALEKSGATDEAAQYYAQGAEDQAGRRDGAKADGLGRRTERLSVVADADLPEEALKMADAGAAERHARRDSRRLTGLVSRGWPLRAT